MIQIVDTRFLNHQNNNVYPFSVPARTKLNVRSSVKKNQAIGISIVWSFCAHFSVWIGP
jgi:hypothetical protein